MRIIDFPLCFLPSNYLPPLPIIMSKCPKCVIHISIIFRKHGHYICVFHGLTLLFYLHRIKICKLLSETHWRILLQWVFGTILLSATPDQAPKFILRNSFQVTSNESIKENIFILQESASTLHSIQTEILKLYLFLLIPVFLCSPLKENPPLHYS